MTGNILQNAFKAAGRGLFRRAAPVAFSSFIIGNSILAAKAGIHIDLDTAAGLLFNAQAICICFTESKKYQTAAFRCGGVFGILASSCMSAQGIDFNTGHILDAWRIASPLMGFGVTATLMGLQKEIAQLAKAATFSKNFVMRTFANTQQYPVALAAMVDSIGLAGMTVSALQHSDKLTLGVVAIWGIGEVGFALTDPRVRDLVKRNFPSVASQPLTPVAANQRPVYGSINPEC